MFLIIYLFKKIMKYRDITTIYYQSSVKMVSCKWKDIKEMHKNCTIHSINYYMALYVKCNIDLARYINKYIST